MTEIITPIAETILIETREEVAVITPQEQAVIVEARTEAVVIAPQAEAVIIEVAQGPPGRDGQSDFPDGANRDIIRYNAATGDWESCSEPFEFQGIILVPMVLPADPEEGFIGYKASDNGIYVAVE